MTGSYNFYLVLVVSTLLVVGSVGGASAKPKTPHESWVACHEWCESHNTTVKSRDKCARQCNKFYNVGGAAAQ